MLSGLISEHQTAMEYRRALQSRFDAEPWDSDLADALAGARRAEDDLWVAMYRRWKEEQAC